MTDTFVLNIDPARDLVIDRVVPVPADFLWMAWTTPEHLKQWFTPKPWQTVDCEIDARPGGIFRTVMRSPEGQEFGGTGCYLEVQQKKRLIWTSSLLPGYRPAPADPAGFHFTGIISFFPQGESTRYQAIAVHGSDADCKKHDAMGFQDGWGTMFDQLVALYEG